MCERVTAVAPEIYATASNYGLARGLVAGVGGLCDCGTGLQLVSRNRDVGPR